MSSPRPNQRLARIATIAVSAALLLPAAASADAVQQDVDFTASGKDDQTLRLGAVEPGASIARTAKFRLVCNRLYKGKPYKKHVEAGQTLDIEYIRSSLDGGAPPAGASATDVGFPPVPASWPVDGKGCTKNPPRLWPLNSSATTFDAPATPGKHVVHVRYRDVLSPAQPDDAGDIVGTPPMAVHFKFKVVSDKHQLVTRFNNAMAKGLVHVQEIDANTARVSAAWKKRPGSDYRVVGSSQPCSVAYSVGHRVFTDAGKSADGKWGISVPTTGNVDTIQSIRIRRGSKESCRNVVQRQATGLPFPAGSPRSVNKVGTSKAKGMAQVIELAGANAHVDVAWKKRPAGTHTMIGSTRPCSVKHLGAAKVFSKAGLKPGGSWKFDVSLRKDHEKLQSIRIKVGGKQKACLNTTILKSS